MKKFNLDNIGEIWEFFDYIRNLAAEDIEELDSKTLAWWRADTLAEHFWYQRRSEIYNIILNGRKFAKYSFIRIYEEMIFKCVYDRMMDLGIQDTDTEILNELSNMIAKEINRREHDTE